VPKGLLSLVSRGLKDYRFEVQEMALEHSSNARLGSIQMIHRLLLCLLLFLPCCSRKAESSRVERHNAAALIHPLIDPAKLATLGDRGANTRIQKVTAILWQAKVEGKDPTEVADNAVELIGWGGTEKGRLTSAAMVRNVTILERLGSTTPEDLDDMRHGKTATVRKGPYAGEILSVDHIIPRAIAPELDNVIANLELMPLSVNRKKNDKIGDRQISMARTFNDAGLLSDGAFQRVMASRK
jgi:hypothetical protein